MSPLLRLAVWDALCDLEADMRYCAVLSAKKRRAHRFLRLGLLSGIVVEAALLYGATQISLLFVVGVILGVFLALLTIWDAMSDNASDAATLKLVAATCRSLTSEMEVLWLDLPSGQSPQVIATVNAGSAPSIPGGPVAWSVHRSHRGNHMLIAVTS